MAIKIEVKIHNRKLFDNFRRSFGKITRETAKKWLPHFAHELQACLPAGTGRLLRETRIEIFDEGLRITGPRHLLYLIVGAAPHEISPREKQALHFQREGREIFAKRVHHPGFPPQPFFHTSLNRAARFLPEACKEAIEEIINA